MGDCLGGSITYRSRKFEPAIYKEGRTSAYGGTWGEFMVRRPLTQSVSNISGFRFGPHPYPRPMYYQSEYYQSEYIEPLVKTGPEPGTKSLGGFIDGLPGGPLLLFWWRFFLGRFRLDGV